MKTLTVTCNNCKQVQWGILNPCEFALRCACGQWNTRGVTVEVTGICEYCKKPYDDHLWSGNLPTCVNLYTGY